MMRKLLMAGLLMAFLTTATTVFAEEVYATKNGKKYHKEACRLIKNKNPHKIDIAEALKKGLKPCGLCFKDQLSLKKNQEK